jgi:hypothetical protein
MLFYFSCFCCCCCCHPLAKQFHLMASYTNSAHFQQKHFHPVSLVFLFLCLKNIYGLSSNSLILNLTLFSYSVRLSFPLFSFYIICTFVCCSLYLWYSEFISLNLVYICFLFSAFFFHILLSLCLSVNVYCTASHTICC